MYCSNCGKEMEHEGEICPACGARLAGGLPGAAGGGSVQGPPPPPPPTAEPTPPAPSVEPAPPPSSSAEKNQGLASGYRVAGLGDRLIALILDSVVVMAIFAVMGSWVASQWGGLITGGFSMEGMPAFLAIGLTLLCGFLYFWFMEGLVGGTIGKRIMGLQVRSVSGGPCTLTQSLVRNLLRIVDGLGVYLVGFFIALFSRLRQRLGDHLAKTVVIEAAPGTFLRIVLVVIWLAVIAGAAWGAYAIHTRTF